MFDLIVQKRLCKRLIVLLVICSFSHGAVFSSASDPARQSNSLTIIVQDEENAPIEGAVVFIDDDVESQKVTNGMGVVDYDLPAGEYIIYTYAPDFMDRVMTVSLDDADEIVEIVHEAARFWSTEPGNAPIGVGEANGVRMAVAGEKIYLNTAYGGPPGTTDYGAIHDFYVYDPQTDNWEQLPDVPYAGLYGISTAYGPTIGGQDAIYILRGYPAGQRTWMARYAISDGEWEEDLNHEIPWQEDLGSPYSGEGFQDYPRNGAVMVWDHDDHMYLFPGAGYSYANYDWYRYSVSNDSWEAMGELPHRQGPGNAAVFVEADGSGYEQDYIYVQFGITPSGDYSEAELWRYGLSNGEWEPLANHPYGADDGSMLAWDGGAYLYHTPGAYVEQLWDTGKDQKRELMRYSIHDDEWAEMEKAPYNRWGGWDDAGGIVYVDGTLYGMKGGSDVAWAEDEYVSGGGDIPSDKLWKCELHEEMHALAMNGADGGGRTYPPQGDYIHLAGADAELLAIPDEGWVLDAWLLNGSPYSNQPAVSLPMNEDQTVTARFLPESFVLYASPSTLDGFGYMIGEGPSDSQVFSLTGQDLEPAQGVISLSGSEHFEISEDNNHFTNTFEMAYDGGTLDFTDVYVRLKEGLDIGVYSDENIQITGGGETIQVAVGGEVGSTSLPYVQDFAGFTSAETLPAGWSLDHDYEYKGDFGSGTAGGLRGSGVLGFQVTGSSPNDYFTATLTLLNETGETITDLLVSYTGKVARTVSGTPEWEVSVAGAVCPELAYSTAEGEDRDLMTIVSDVTIYDGDAFDLSWYTTSEGTSGHRRQIGLTNLNVDVVSVVETTADLHELPDNANIAVRGDVDVHEDIIIENLIIEEGHVLHIMPEAEVTVNGLLLNMNEGESAADGLVIRSDETGTGSLLHYTADVESTVERYISPQMGDWHDPDDHSGWHLISSPLQNQAIEGDWTPWEGDQPAYEFYAWCEEDAKWLDQQDDANMITHFEPGRGYLVAYMEETTNLFQGMINVSDIEEVSVVRLGDEDDFHGWNLLGNPYASALQWNDGNWVLPDDLGGLAKLWDEADKSYKDVLEEGVIPSMNGFFVYYDPDERSSASLTIPAAARTHDETSWYKENQEIRLLTTDQANQSAQESILRFKPEATQGFDLKHDAYFLPGYAPETYFLVNQKKLSTYTAPQWHDDLVVPMGFGKNHADSFYIHLTTHSVDADLYLVDLKTEQEHALTMDSPYGFTAQQDDDTHRFELRFSPSDPVSVAETVEEDVVSVFVMDNVLHMHFNSGDQNRQLELIDLAGRSVMQRNLGWGQIHTQPLNIPQGLYIVRITTTGSVVTRRVMVY